MSRLSSKRDVGTARDLVDEHVDQAVREFPEVDPAVEAILARIDKIERYLNKTMAETLTRHRLSEGDYKVLVKLRLAEDNRLSPGELSDSLMLSTGAMTNRLDRLEERGLVVRKPEPRDRRGVLVELTPEGHDALAAAVHEQAAREIKLLGALSEEEKAAVNDLLRKV